MPPGGAGDPGGEGPVPGDPAGGKIPPGEADASLPGKVRDGPHKTICWGSPAGRNTKPRGLPGIERGRAEACVQIKSVVKMTKQICMFASSFLFLLLVSFIQVLVVLHNIFFFL